MMREILAIDERAYRTWADLSRGVRVGIEAINSPAALTQLVPARKSVGSVAVIGLTGFISQKPSLFSMMFGGTSSTAFAREVVAALSDSSVGAVVMAIDSPGGEVFGVPEAAAVIRSARGSKPLVAVADPVAGSAAYWIASQADEIVGTISSLTGSVGAFAQHVDESKALETQGVKVTTVKYGERKAELDSASPLSEAGLAQLQARVDYYGQLFEGDVAKGRKVSVAKVQEKFGQGASLTAADALSAGVIDRIGTLDEVVRALANGKRSSGARAYDGDEIRARMRLAGLR